MLFGRLTGRRAHWVAVPAVAGAFVVACAVFARARTETFTTTLFSWIVAGDFEASVSALVDPLSGVMLLVVTGVGLLIHIYSIGYMHDDAGYARYFPYLNVFLFSITMRVVASNFLVLYFFCEAFGLCSYMLIGFLSQREW